MSLRLTFYGAAGTVTGSKYLVETDRAKVLVDCGLFQGKKELRLKNWNEPDFDVKSLSCIVLTHAHIDHTGYLPRVVKQGYSGPIYCTPATKELLKLLLIDTAYLQEEEARHFNKYGKSKHHPALPLYNQKDAEETLALLRVIKRDRPQEIAPGVEVTPYCAGHLLGSTILNLSAGGKVITFSGDIGRFNTPLLPDPKGVPLGDLLLCESTHGDRLHDDSDTERVLIECVKRAASLKGPLIIPAFAIGRTQNLLYYLGDLERRGKIPILPVFVDSPMAVDATSIYRSYSYDFDEEAKDLMRAGETPLLTEQTFFVHRQEESKKLNSLKGGGIIISASGMVTGGRIVHHMLHWLPVERATILFAGFQAEGTRGQKIQSGAPSIRIFSEDVPIRAQIKSISGLSAHGDRDELLQWLRSCNGNPTKVKIIHGEPESSKAFAATLKEQMKWNASVAQFREVVEV